MPEPLDDVEDVARERLRDQHVASARHWSIAPSAAKPLRTTPTFGPESSCYLCVGGLCHPSRAALGLSVARRIASAGAGAVVGGQQAAPGAWPFAAALIDASMTTRSSGQTCGAVVVSPREVITAAHCVTADGSAPPAPARARHRRRPAAAARRSACARARRQRARPPAASTRETLAERPRTARARRARCRRRATRRRRGRDVAGASATALGWGSTTATPAGDFPDALRQTVIDIEPDSACCAGLRRRLRRREHALRGHPQGRPRHLPGRFGRPAGRRRPGRPVVIGFTSFGGACGQPGAPGAYVARDGRGELARSGRRRRAPTAPSRSRSAEAATGGIRPVAKPKQRSRARP